MNTRKFRTKTEMIVRENGKKLDGIWEMAIDIGYSAVKVFSPIRIACFPSYAKRVDNSFQFAGREPESAILYRDLTSNQMWLIGEIAQNTMEARDTSDSEASLYGRERYDNPMFKVIMEAGLGIALIGANLKNEKVIVQTGLPERYMSDEDALNEAVSGEHKFALKIGTGEWMTFNVNIDSKNVYVMSQPKGTLFSVCINKDGSFHPDANKYLSSSVIVFDPGFGTLDLFPIKSGVVGHGETYADLGMKRVLQETAKLISAETKVNIPVPAMQKYLETGTVKYVDRKAFESKEIPFDKLLAQANNSVCEEAIARMMGSLSLIDYNYLIITGGTGAAWLYNIEEKFKKFSTLSLIKGNQNDDLPFIYSNVRGYYFYRYRKLRKELAEQARNS